jgi:hypothetical protein
MMDCLKVGGVQVNFDQIAQDLFGMDDRKYIDVAIDTVTVAPHASALQSVPAVLLDGCRGEALSFDFMAELLDLLHVAVSDVSDRVIGRDEWIEASAKERSCLQDVGARFGDYNLALSEGESKADAVVSRFLSGALSQRDALAKLRDLRTNLRSGYAARDQASSCSSDRLSVERRLVTVEQANFLASNPGFVDGLAEKFARQLRLLKPDLLKQP